MMENMKNRFESADIACSVKVSDAVNIKGNSIAIGEDTIIETGVEIVGKNIRIGKDVYIGNNSIIRGENINIGDNCIIFGNVMITVTKEFILGSRSKISKNCVFRCYKIKIGKELWCNENVDIGGGGCWQNSAMLEVGDFVHIGKGAMINVCKPVHIGSKTGIGIESMIFTHSAGNGQSVLEGYSHTEKTVWIGNHVSLFTRAFVTPGTIVEDGAMIGAMSYAVGTIKKGLNVGIPTVLKKEIFPLDSNNKIEMLINIMERALNGEADIISINQDLNKKNEKAIVVIHEYDDVKKMVSLIKNQYKEIIVVAIRCNTADNKNTVICVENETISGRTTELSEKLRDIFRREGIILDYSGYTPFKLDAFLLREKGIER